MKQSPLTYDEILRNLKRINTASARMHMEDKSTEKQNKRKENHEREMWKTSVSEGQCEVRERMQDYQVSSSVNVTVVKEYLL